MKDFRLNGMGIAEGYAINLEGRECDDHGRSFHGAAVSVFPRRRSPRLGKWRQS